MREKERNSLGKPYIYWFNTVIVFSPEMSVLGTQLHSTGFTT